MPRINTLTLYLPPKKMREIGRLARRSGFKSRSKWASFTLSRVLDAWFGESPKMTSRTVTRRLRATKKYSETFLRELNAALTYADRAAQS